MKRWTSQYESLGFDVGITANGFVIATAKECTLGNHDDTITCFFTAHERGYVNASFMFDKLPLDYASLELLNKFNEESTALKAYRDSEEGAFTLDYFNVIKSESDLYDFFSLAMDSLIDLSDDPILQELTKLTES